MKFNPKPKLKLTEMMNRPVNKAIKNSVSNMREINNPPSSGDKMITGPSKPKPREDRMITGPSKPKSAANNPIPSKHPSYDDLTADRDRRWRATEDWLNERRNPKPKANPARRYDTLMGDADNPMARKRNNLNDSVKMFAYGVAGATAGTAGAKKYQEYERNKSSNGGSSWTAHKRQQRGY